MNLAGLSSSELIAVMQKGLPFRNLEKLQGELQVSAEALAARLGIARATLHRRKATGRLTNGESEMVVRFARLFRQAAETLGDAEDARSWLSSPQIGLGGAVPLDYARTEVGAREVENLLGRIEHGVYA